MTMSKNINIGANLLPTQSGQAMLGDSSHRWVIDASQLSTVPIANGGTGGGSASLARSNLDIYSKGEVDTLVNYTVSNALNSKIPACTSSDNGKVLMVMNSIPTWASIPSADGVKF